MGSDGLGSVPRGLDGSGSGNRVPETRGIKKVPGSGDSVPKVPKVTFYFERALLYFESILCKLKINFCTLKVYFCTLPQCLLQVALKINTARAKKRW